MRRHVLVTVSDDPHAMQGVRFVCGFLLERDVELTLFYTAPRPAEVWAEERDHWRLEEYDTRAAANRERGRRALDAAMDMLLEAGFDEALVQAKLTMRGVTTGADILRECEQGRYDAVALGRSGAAGLESLMHESVTRDILDRGFVAPLWVCRSWAPGRDGVLLCLDGSGASLRMADHVGFMLEAQPAHRVTLFAVSGRGPLGAGDPAPVFARAREILAENGVGPDRVDEATATGGAAGAILAEAARGAYAVVATGRTGQGRGLLRRVFMGSVSTALLRDLDGAALWVRA